VLVTGQALVLKLPTEDDARLATKGAALSVIVTFLEEVAERLLFSWRVEVRTIKSDHLRGCFNSRGMNGHRTATLR
jgi:hypothetical protein